MGSEMCIRDRYGESLVRSKRRAAPLGMFSKADRAAFLKTLTAKERDQLARGTKWYRETYWGGTGK